MDAGKFKTMRSKPPFLLVVAAVALTAIPALAQQGFSESFTFLKAVRDRDGSAVQNLVSNPNPAILNAREPGTGEGALHILESPDDLVLQ